MFVWEDVLAVSGELWEPGTLVSLVVAVRVLLTTIESVFHVRERRRTCDRTNENLRTKKQRRPTP